MSGLGVGRSRVLGARRPGGQGPEAATVTAAAGRRRRGLIYWIFLFSSQLIGIGLMVFVGTTLALSMVRDRQVVPQTEEVS